MVMGYGDATNRRASSKQTAGTSGTVSVGGSSSRTPAPSNVGSRSSGHWQDLIRRFDPNAIGGDTPIGITGNTGSTGILGGGGPAAFGAAAVGDTPTPIGEGDAAMLAAGEPLNTEGDPLTGFASRFTPSGAELLQNEPAALLAETLKAMGINPSGGIYGMMEPLANDMNQLFALFNGGQVGSLSDILNYGNSLFSNYATPGGEQVSYGGGLQNLFNAGTGTPLGDFLGGGVGEDPQAQIRNFMSLYGALVGNSVPLIQQGGLMNYANTAARDYIAQIARGDASSGNFAGYINARQPFAGY